MTFTMCRARSSAENTPMGGLRSLVTTHRHHHRGIDSWPPASSSGAPGIGRGAPAGVWCSRVYFIIVVRCGGHFFIRYPLLTQKTMLILKYDPQTKFQACYYDILSTYLLPTNIPSTPFIRRGSFDRIWNFFHTHTNPGCKCHPASGYTEPDVEGLDLSCALQSFSSVPMSMVSKRFGRSRDTNAAAVSVTSLA